MSSSRHSNRVDRRSDDRFLQLILWTLGVVLSVNLLVGGAFAPATVLAARFHGFFENPNNIGLIVVLAVPLSFSKMLRSKSWWDRGLWMIFVINMLVCGSRTALVASVVAMGVIVGVRFIHNVRAVIGIGVVLIVAAVALSQSDFFKERVLREGSIETMSNRTLFWDLARERYIPQRPRLGHGFGSDRDIHDHYGVVLKDLKLRGYGVMSSYFGLAVAMGIPFAVIFFMVMWAIPLRNLLLYYRDGRLVLYSAVVIAGLLVSVTESSIYSAGNPFAYLFWTVVMLMVRRFIYRKNKIRQTRGGALDRSKPNVKQVGVRQKLVNKSRKKENAYSS